MGIGVGVGKHACDIHASPAKDLRDPNLDFAEGGWLDLPPCRSRAARLYNPGLFTSFGLHGAPRIDDYDSCEDFSNGLGFAGGHVSCYVLRITYCVLRIAYSQIL